jgi:GT2 family glycosyltransferase
MGADPPVTVAVVSWNTRALLARCLDSLRPETERGRADVWVVDNASTDGSAALVREGYGWTKLVACEENLGFGGAVNLVAARTSAPWLAMANADVALRPGALDRLLEAAARDPGAGAVAPRLVLPDGTTQHSVFGFPTLPYVFVFNSGAFHLSRDLADRMALLDRWDCERARRVPWAVGAMLLVRREAWEQAGGFDARQWMYAEDLDLGWRLREAGWATRYEPSAVVDHESRAAAKLAWGGPAEIDARWQRSTYGWMMRRRGVLRTWAVAAMNFAGSGARFLVLSLAALVAPERWGEQRRTLRAWTLVHLSGLASRRRVEGRR